MGLLANLFGKKKSKVPTIAPAHPEQVAESTDIAAYNQAVQLVAIGDSLKDELTTKLQKAFSEPKLFYDEHDEYILAERGLMYPKHAKDTTKFVFIDTLIEKGQMAEVDWKAAEEDIRFGIAEIIKTKEYPVSFTVEDQFEEEDTYTVINLINQEELIPAGYALAILDIQSDCYVFTIIPLEQCEVVEAIFNQLT